MLALGGGLAGGAGALVAANLGVAAQRYGIEYLRRLAVWGVTEDMDDPGRFPARLIAVAAAPRPLPPDPDGPARLRVAFARVAPAHGLGGLTLDAALARSATTALLVLHRDRLAFEAYANGADAATPLPSMSMAKTILALLVTAAIGRGEIAGFDAPADALLPDVPGLRGSGVTLRHLLHMAAGLRYESEWPLHRLSFTGLFLGPRVAYFTPDIRRYVASAHPGAPPGAEFHYDDRSAQLVGMILERATRRSASEAVEARLWQRIGTERGASWNLDRAGGFEKMESGLNAVARDWLRLGRLMLADGRWDGAEVLPPALVREALAPPARPDPPSYHPDGEAGGLYYGMFSWGYARPGRAPDVFAQGLFGQVLYVARDAGAVLLRTGRGAGGIDWPELLRDLGAALDA